MVIDPGAAALYAELNQYTSETVLRSVSNALGVATSDASPVDAGSWPSVATYFVDWADPDVLTLYVVSAGRFVRHQVAKTGEQLTVCVAMSRVRRVVEERGGAGVAIAIELEADRIAIELGGAITGERQMLLSGSATASGYLIGAQEEPGLTRLVNFAAALRSQMR